MIRAREDEISRLTAGREQELLVQSQESLSSGKLEVENRELRGQIESLQSDLEAERERLVQISAESSHSAENQHRVIEGLRSELVQTREELQSEVQRLLDASAAKDAELTSLTFKANELKSSLAALSATYDAASGFETKFVDAEKMCQELQLQLKVRLFLRLCSSQSFS